MAIWKPITDFPDYEVSNDGRVYSLRSSIELKPRIIRNYKYVCLYPGKRWKRIHRLVAKAFIPNPDNLPEVNHKDLDKMNCHDWNLEWKTHKGNTQHAIANGAHKTCHQNGEDNDNSKLTVERVLAIREDTRSQRQIAKDYGISQQTVSVIKLYKRWKHLS